MGRGVAEAARGSPREGSGLMVATSVLTSPHTGSREREGSVGRETGRCCGGFRQGHLRRGYRDGGDDELEHGRDEAARPRRELGSGAGRRQGARGLLEAAGILGPAATAAHFGAVWGSEQVMLPALGVAPPLTEGGAEEVSVDALHHLVYAGATGIAYSLLDR